MVVGWCIKGDWSRVVDQGCGSMVVDQGRWIKGDGSRKVDQGWWIKGGGSRVVDQEWWIKGDDPDDPVVDPVLRPGW